MMSYDRCKLCWMPAKQPLMAMEEECSKEGCPGVEKRKRFEAAFKDIPTISNDEWQSMLRQDASQDHKPYEKEKV
jgi:hypothetical protein